MESKEFRSLLKSPSDPTAYVAIAALAPAGLLGVILVIAAVLMHS